VEAVEYLEYFLLPLPALYKVSGGGGLVVCYPTPSEGWRRGRLLRRPNSRATPKDLDQRKIEVVPTPRRLNVVVWSPPLYSRGEPKLRDNYPEGPDYPVSLNRL